MKDDLMNSFNDIDVSTTRKVPICLVLDISGSMGERDGTKLTKIEELNKNVREFIQFVRSNAKARAICDLSMISFGDDVTVVNGYSHIESIKDTIFRASGPTPLGEAMKKALELLELRRSYYKQHEIEHYKPILMLMTDGEPTDNYHASAKEIAEKVNQNKIKILPFVIGKNTDSKPLLEFSPKYKPKVIRSSDDFKELFELLSKSTLNPAEDPWDTFMGGSGDGETV
jgi:uncharacterized protein YegL